MSDPFRLMAELLYGGGLRVNECLNLRVKDVDPKRRTVMVMDGKGCKDRITLLIQHLICRPPHVLWSRTTCHTYDCVIKIFAITP